MSWRWLKRILPRSLYGRAALILILPVVMLQLVVSVGFIQRHFNDVTRQMTRSVVDEIALVADTLPGDPAAAESIAAALGLTLTVPAAADPPPSRRLFYDLSGGVVLAELAAQLPDLQSARLDGTSSVAVTVGTAAGPIEVEFPRKRVSASNPHQLLVIMVVFGVILTGIAYLFLRNQLRPIKRLAAAAEDFGKGRMVSYKPGGAAEVRAAGTAFLEMRGRIERQAQARNLMLSGISHDLRTPLTRMRLALSLIDDPEAEALRSDVDDMARMVDAYLDFARGDASDLTEFVDLRAIVEQAAADCGRDGRAIAVLPPEGEPAPIRARPLALRRAVANLIGNALRHGAHVEVGLTWGERSARITVEDDGPGIPADRRDEAVRPFVRLDPARNQDGSGGVGLGLAIVADVARSHGGTLRLGESDRLGGLRADLVIAR